MQASVARLYAHILNFSVEALKWYRDKRITHAFKSIFQPWNLKFRQDYEAIESEALQIRRLASVAMKAEVRDTRLGVVQGTKELELVKQEVSELKAENQRLHGLLFSRLEKMESSMLCECHFFLFVFVLRSPVHNFQSSVFACLFFPTMRTKTDFSYRRVSRASCRLYQPTRNTESSPHHPDDVITALELPPNFRGFAAFLPVNAEQAPRAHETATSRSGEIENVVFAEKQHRITHRHLCTKHCENFHGGPH